MVKIFQALCALILFATTPSLANVIGTGAQNFNTIPSGIDFLTVHSSETLKPGIINIGLMGNYAVNSLPYIEGIPQGRTEFNDTLLSSEFNIGVGLLRNWEIGLSLPYILKQTVAADKTLHGEFSSNGNTEVRFHNKVRLFGNSSKGVALVGTVNYNRTINNPYKGNPSRPTYNLEVVGDKTFGNLAIGLNLGHRWTNRGEAVPNAMFEPISNQIIASAAVNFYLPKLNTKIIAEIFGSVPAKERNSDADRNSSSLEMIGGFKHDATHSIAVHVGGGTELLHGLASPDWRVYAGVNYTFGPVLAEKPKLFRVDANRLILQNILFEFDSTEMLGDFKDVFDELAEYLRKIHTFRQVRIEGHTDAIGTEEYNFNLSNRRAEAVMNFLVKGYNFDAKKFEFIGMGETQPIADNGNYQGRQTNRRVELKISR